MTPRALSFGSVASAYEQHRPGYPETLVDRVLAYAAGPIRSALEIGAGTGKATRVFAARGIAVTATDPDAAMLAELRKHVASSVVTVQAAFEDLPLTQSYDLVYAAAALHWTAPEHRWSRVAALLTPGGIFASFGGQLHLEDEAIDALVRGARSQFLADDGFPSPDDTPDDGPMQWPGSELSRSELFDDVQQVTIERRVSLSAHEYVGHLSTISAYLELSDQDRASVFERVLAVIPERVTLNADLILHLARAAEPRTTRG
jgi:SAM-dependent methyltransferase